MSKIEFEMRKRINQKLDNVGANSKKNAVTFEEAKLDLQEQFWLPYLLGSPQCNIRKNGNNRFYH